MTRNTDSNYIQPMFWGIALVVMVLFCWIATGTSQSIGPRQFARFNGVHYGYTSFVAFVMTPIIVSDCFFMVLFASFRLGISKSVISTQFSTFWSFAKFFNSLDLAYFASCLKSIRPSTIFVKFGKWFCLFARTTRFVYDNFSHFRLLNRRFWLEPIVGYAPTVGSPYYSNQRNYIN